jgi:outer membrane protein, heavy metal efflux system
MSCSVAAGVGRPEFPAVPSWYRGAALCLVFLLAVGAAPAAAQVSAKPVGTPEQVGSAGGPRALEIEDWHLPPDDGVGALPEDGGLDDLVRFALRHNPAVGAAFHRWRAAVERAPQAGSLPDPQVSLGLVLDEVDRSTDYMGERYSISQMFPWFGTLGLREDIALSEAGAEARRYEAARLELVERVTNAWVEYAWLHEAVATSRENLALLSRLEAVARAMYRAGTVSQADVNRAQVELGRLDNQLRSLMDMLGPAQAEINAVLGRPAHARLPRPVAPSHQDIGILPQRDDESWLALARDANPELAARRHEVERERYSVDLARKQYYPDFMFGVEYARNGSGRMAMMDGGGKDMLVGMISINVPLRSARNDAGLREARSRLAAAGRQIHAEQNTLESRLKMALYAYRDGERRLQLYGGTLVPKARQSLASTEAAYRAGEAGFTDLVDTQRVLLEFQLAHERAAADRIRAQARIYALVGDTNHEVAAQ